MFDQSDNLNGTDGVPFDGDRKNPFSSPEDYFDTFSQKLFAKIELEEELKDFPVLAALPKQQPFVVPGHYFENALEWQQELAAYPGLAQVPKPALINPGETYFEDLAGHVAGRVELAEELRPYATLYALDKQHGFKVEAAYFDDLATRVKERLYAPETTRASLFDTIIRLVLRPRVALAFGLALVLGISLFVYNRHPELTASGDCNTLACLEKSDLLNDQTLHALDEESLIDAVNVKALDKQVSLHNNKPDSTVQEQYIIENVNTDQLMEEL